ncbi:MAG: hypothetical protein KatS3mg110_1382 [Pirellulaceae bacterium]|nr:MAG: hypothetical protein KatS3mg110_1382 [Pirellulaceae bacterium]
MTRNFISRREFVRSLGVSAAVLPWITNLPSLGWASQTRRKQRLVIVFTPNGVVPDRFWPREEGEAFTITPILEPLAPWKDRMLVLHGVCDKIRGDGDNHMRGMGCLLTGIELFPGNIQGGSHTPAGWASGISIDQEIKNFLQSQPETRTRFGSLEFGVLVPDRADTWTRMVYAGPNQPIAPIDDPYQMFHKFYGRQKDQRLVRSVLDEVLADLNKVQALVSQEDRQLLEQHMAFVRQMEEQLKAQPDEQPHAVPELEPGVEQENDRMPELTRMQLDLLVHALENDFARVATFQFTNSVGQARMRWLDISEGHHELSHEPDSNEVAQDKLTRINRWYCEQLAYLVKRLAETPEPGGPGTLLDNTTIIWTNELGKGNSHTLDNIPFVLVGNGLGFRMGRVVRLPRVPHNRLHLALAHAMGHYLERFGNPDYCGDGPLVLT